MKPQTLLKQALLTGLLMVSLISPTEAKPAPIEVFADQVDVDLKNHTTHFSKNVKILFDTYTLKCRRAELILDNKNQRLIKIIMQGNVLIQSRGSVLKGKRVILDVQTKRLQIEGQVYSRMQMDQPINLNFN